MWTLGDAIGKIAVRHQRVQARQVDVDIKFTSEALFQATRLSIESGRLTGLPMNIRYLANIGQTVLTNPNDEKGAIHESVQQRKF